MFIGSTKKSKVSELEMLKLLNKSMKQFPGSKKQKETIKELNKLRKSAGLKPIPIR